MASNDYHFIIQNVAQFISSFEAPSRHPELHWYLTPEEHVVDAILWVILFSAATILAQRQERTLSSRRPEHSAHPESPFSRWVMDICSYILSICLLCQIHYKYWRGNLAIVYLLQPCHVVALLTVYLLHAPRTPFNVLIFNVSNQYLLFTALAMAVPDTAQLDQMFEQSVFWIEHGVLLFSILYLNVMQRFPLYNDYNGYVHGFGWGGLFFYLVQLPCALVTGVNLNYMLYPPPNQPIAGPHYRKVMCMFLALVSFLTGYIFPRLLVRFVNHVSGTKHR